MTVLLILLGVLFGAVFAASIAFLITMLFVSKSNDFGNSKGDFQSFAVCPIHMLQRKNFINPQKYE